MALPQQPVEKRKGAVRWKTLTWTVMKVLCTGCILAVIARHVWINWGELSEHSWSISPVAVVAAFFATSATFLCQSLVWGLQVRTSALNVRLSRCIGGALVANLGKYIPGKIWAIMGRVYFLKKDGGGTAHSSALAVLSQSASITAAAFCGLLTIPLVLKCGKSWLPWVLGALPFFAAIGLHPKIYFGVLNWGLRIAGREELDRKLSYRQVWLWILLAFCAIVPIGVAFAVFSASITAVALADVPFLVGTMALAVVVGLVAFFAPAGLGVREGVLLLLLPHVIEPEAAIVVSIGWRLWLTPLEVLWAGAGFMLLKATEPKEMASELKG
jgi:hypothetical protein